MKICIFLLYCFLFLCQPLALFSSSLLPRDMKETFQTNDSLLTTLDKTRKLEDKLNILSQLAFLQLQHDIQLSLKYTEKMLSLMSEKPELPRSDIHYTNAAIILLKCDIYDKALELFLKALSITEKEQNRAHIRSIKNNIGGVYFRLGQPHLALTYFSDALHSTQELISQGDSSQQRYLHAFYNNIGLCYAEINNPTQASQNIQQAISLCDTNDYEDLGQYYNNIAQFYYDEGKKNEAFDCMWKSIHYRERINDEYGLGRNYIGLAQLYFKENNIKKARYYTEKAIATGQKINSKLLLQNAYTIYIDLFELEKDYQSSNSYLKKLFDLKNELINDTISSKITALKLQYDFDKKITEDRIKIQNKELKYKLTLVIILSLLIGITLLYFLARNRNKRIQLEKINLEKDLEFRNKELTSNVMFLLRNSDLIHSIINRLQHIKLGLKGQQAGEIKDIISELQSVMKNDLWDEFKVRFNQVHLDFYKKLQEYCPDLSPADLKLCAFLRLNMSSKEIAALCGVTVRSVEVMRSRLRKKLKISNTDINLNTYLSEF